MKVDWVIGRLREGAADPGVLREVARDLGWELPRRREDAVTDFRRQAARLPRSDDAYAQGFRDALLELTTAYQRALAEDAEREHAASLAAKRAWWPVIRRLLASPATPTQLAQAFDKDLSRISVLLRELRAAGLAESVAPPEGQDGRTRVHLLTPAGRQLARSLTVPPWVEPALAFMVECLRRLLVTGTLHRRAVEAMAAEALQPLGVDGDQVARLLLDRCRAEGVLGEEAGRWLPDPVTREVRAQLERAVGESGFEPPFMGVLERRARNRRLPLVVRAGEETPWNVYLTSLNREARLLPGLDVDGVERANAETALDGKPYLLLYESPALLRRDAAGEAIPALAQRARSCFVLTTPGETVQPPCVPIEVHA
jgi:DNA-binding MarR family transcriptional regulator